METPSGARQSHIPVLATRHSISSPYLGLVPPSRHLSVSSSPSHPSPASQQTGSSSPANSSVSSFRSFRNLLSFGPNKQSPHANPPGIPKGPFSGFGSIRRSLTSDRTPSTPHLNNHAKPPPLDRSNRQSPPVIAIELPHYNIEPLMGPYELGAGISSDSKCPRLESLSPDVSLSPHVSDEGVECAPAFAKGPSDLSTILEADVSGISKHIPSTDNSGDDSRLNVLGITPDTPSTPALSFRDGDDEHGQHSDDGPSQDSSALDLSTSELTHEVYQAMSESKDRAGWLSGVVMDGAVDDVHADTDSPRSERIAVHDLSVDSATFDEDFTTMLKSSHDHTRSHTLLASPFLRSPARRLRTGTPSSPPPSPSRSHAVPVLLPGPSSSSSSSSSHSPDISPPAAPKKSAPRLGHSRLPSSIAPRLARSASDRPSLQCSENGAPEPERIPRASSHSPERPSTADASQSRHHLSTPYSRNSWTSSRRSESSAGSEVRPPVARLHNPARVSPRLASARPVLRHLATSPYHPSHEHEDASPVTRPPSSVGTAPGRLQHYRSGDADRVRPGWTRHRERSSSVAEFRPSPDLSFVDRPTVARLTADRVGPRTARVLAAAGLLQQDLSGESLPSRHTPSRLSVDRGVRTRNSPSRMAFSEAGSSSSWSRRHGSMSHAGAMSDIGGPVSPRTTFSAGSSAATSVSSAFAQQHHLQVELQQMQERHSLETGALLHALADSQRTTRLLRDENAQLRDRLQGLEDQLAEAHAKLYRMQFTPPTRSTLLEARATNERLTGYHVLGSSPRLAYTQPHSYLSYLENSTTRPWSSPTELDIPRGVPPTPAQRSPTIHEHTMPMDEEHAQHPDPALQSPQRRMSNSSSVFNGPPSTMSMIMHEDDALADTSSLRSGSPSSPTMVYRKIDPGPEPGPDRRHGHAHSRSISTVGNISPTTANFSMVPSSPGSLNLRPEDEKHLGDIPSFHLGAEFSGYDDYDDEEGPS